MSRSRLVSKSHLKFKYCRCLPSSSYLRDIIYEYSVKRRSHLTPGYAHELNGDCIYLFIVFLTISFPQKMFLTFYEARNETRECQMFDNFRLVSLPFSLIHTCPTMGKLLKRGREGVYILRNQLQNHLTPYLY